MPTDPATPRRDWTVGPAKTGAAGFLGGAGVVGLLWAITARAPAPTQAPDPPARAFTAAPTTQPAEPHTTAVALPEPTLRPLVSTATGPSASIETSTPIDLPPASQTRNEIDPQEWADLPVSDPAVPPPDPRPTSTPTTAALRVRVNRASAAELELLPGVGPVLASRIIEERGAHGPFRSADDLKRVRGIGEKTAARLAPLVAFD